MIQPRTKRSFLAAFTTVFSCVWRRPGIRQQPLVSDSSVRPPGAAHTLCVLRKSYLLREKTADQVVSGLKLKLKTSPTKVRLVSLKKSWKQAGRSHERRDVDFAESADFAEFDLRNRTQLNGHSNTYKKGFPLACSMPNFNDVRLKEMPKKGAKNRKKSSSHRAVFFFFFYWQTRTVYTNDGDFLYTRTVKPALNDHWFKRPPAFSDRFFMHGESAIQTALC